MKALEPNMYRVDYRVMEGDNYAGGWGKRTTTVTDLGDCLHISNIDAVTPIYVQEFPAVDRDVLIEATCIRQKAEKAERHAEKVARATKHLADLKAVKL